MKISVERDDINNTINIAFSGTPGDAKQPIDYVFFHVKIRRTAALKMALAIKNACEKTNKRAEVEI